MITAEVIARLEVEAMPGPLRAVRGALELAAIQPVPHAFVVPLAEDAQRSRTETETISQRLDAFSRAFDPVKERTRRLYPNDQREARWLPRLHLV